MRVRVISLKIFSSPFKFSGRIKQERSIDFSVGAQRQPALSFDIFCFLFGVKGNKNLNKNKIGTIPSQAQRRVIFELTLAEEIGNDFMYKRLARLDTPSKTIYRVISHLEATAIVT